MTPSSSHGGAQWPGPIPLTIPGSGRFLGDAIDFSPDPPPGPGGLPPLASLSGFSLTGTDIAELVINGELAVPVPQCPWDCDGSNDGVVAVTDLLALLGQYDALAPIGCTGGSCDFDANGCVDVADLLKLLGHYDPAGVGCP